MAVCCRRLAAAYAATVEKIADMLAAV